MEIKAVLFDLDDTLIVDEAVSMEAMKSTAELATSLAGVSAPLFVNESRKVGAELWSRGSCHHYTKAIGISFNECLWGEFEGEAAELKALRAWALDYRVAVFDAALRAQEVSDGEIAERLAEHFSKARRQLQRLMPDAVETLARLKRSCKVALLTNGAPDLQREKIAASGLGRHFDAIAVSGEHGIGKPRPEIFHRLLKELDVEPEAAVMVGNSLERDIAGALNAGLAAAIWLQVPGSEEHDDVTPHHTVRGLHEVPPLVDGFVR
jgi:putative hydrolase of the HAD superfamily